MILSHAHESPLPYAESKRVFTILVWRSMPSSSLNTIKRLSQPVDEAHPQGNFSTKVLPFSTGIHTGVPDLLCKARCRRDGREWRPIALIICSMRSEEHTSE